jgi:hypothetical protein
MESNPLSCRPFKDVQAEEALATGWFIPGMPLVLRLVHELHRCREAKPDRTQLKQIESSCSFFSRLVQGAGLHTGTVMDYNETGCSLEQCTPQGPQSFPTINLYGRTIELGAAAAREELLGSVGNGRLGEALLSVVNTLETPYARPYSTVMLDLHGDFSSVKRMCAPEGESQTKAVATISANRGIVMVSACGMPYKPRHWLLARVEEIDVDQA